MDVRYMSCIFLSQVIDFFYIDEYFYRSTRNALLLKQLAENYIWKRYAELSILCHKNAFFKRY